METHASHLVDVDLPSAGRRVYGSVTLYVKDLPKVVRSQVSKNGNQTNLWIKQENLPALLGALRHDYTSRGVDSDEEDDDAPVPADGQEDGDTSVPAGGGQSSAATVIFDHRDGAFVVRNRGAVLKRFHVPKRKTGSSEFLSVAEYKRQMTATRADVDQWVRENGLLH